MSGKRSKTLCGECFCQIGPVDVSGKRLKTLCGECFCQIGTWFKMLSPPVQDISDIQSSVGLTLALNVCVCVCV